MSRINLSLIFLLASILLKAQDAPPVQPQMADALRDSGKIYVVITVIALVFAAIIFFLAMLERKIKKIETQLKDTGRLNSNS